MPPGCIEFCRRTHSARAVLVLAAVTGMVLVASAGEGDRRSAGEPEAPDAAMPPPPPDEPAGAPAKAHSSYRAARVVIVSEDGMRPDLVASQHLKWHELLYQQGAYTWKARTIRDASTLPAHASMLSGVDTDEHGLTWNNWRPERGFIKAPTIFCEAGEHGMKTAMFVGKSKLKHIARPGTVGYYERPGYYCKKVAEQAAAYLVHEKPPLTFIHFSDPDEVGHAAGWGSAPYVDAIEHSDRCLGIVVEALIGAGMLDDTLLIVSADHGGHNKVHSGGLLIDREIPWIARGPGVRRGYRIKGPVSTLDTAATALHALDLPLSPSLVGRPVLEMYSPE